MYEITDELIKKNQNLINYTNADSMFNALDELIQVNGRDFILQEKHDTELDCVKSYVLRSNAIRFACDAIEHYAKAILIQNGLTWDESKTLGHNLLKLFRSLDKNSRIALSTAFIPHDVYMDRLRNNLNNDDRWRENGFEGVKVDVTPLGKMFFVLDRPVRNVKQEYYEKMELNKIKRTSSIRELKIDQRIEEELEKLLPTSKSEQQIGVKARFPGQTLVGGNADFLISLAYAMKDLSFIHRKGKEIYEVTK